MERTSTRRYADAALAAVVLLVVGMMIVPLPTPLLDVLITANMSVGVLLLLVALYVPDGLSFTSFPTLLLITTLYRLALNVSSTRLILLQADAGEVITAFGGFVVRGNYVVGAVIFLILTLIQFLVIAKGSERVASEDEDSSLGGEVGRQIFGNPRALGIAAVFLVILGVIPGLPTVPFFVLALVFGGLAWRLMRRAPTAEGEGDAALRPEAQREQRAKKQLVPLVVPISVELGPELAAELLDARGGGPLLEDEIPRVRESLFLALGIPVPGVRARSAPIGPREYVIALQEIPVSRGDAPTGLFVPSAPSALASFGVSGVAHLDPQTQREGSIASLESRAVLEAAGLPALTATQLVGRHLEEIVRRRGHELVGLQETQAMLDQLERAYPALVRNVVPKPVGLPLLADILRRLVEEGVSIRPLREILEALAIHAAVEKDPVALTEAVRAALRRPITHRHVRSGAVAVHLLDPLLEDTVRDAIQRTATGSYLALPPDLARDIVAAVSRALTSATHPVLLTQSDVRRFVRRLLENELPEVVVLSYQELDPAVTVQPLGRIGLKG